MKKYSLHLTLVLAVALTILTGCDSGTDTPQEQKKVYAGTNSTFTYKKTYKDAAGNTSGSDTTKTSTVTEGPHSYGGKDTTIKVIEDGRDTTIMSYEANGNVSLYRGNGVPGAPIPLPVPTWWTLPVKSKSTISIVDQDLNINLDIGGFNVTVKKVKGDANYIGAETIVVDGESLSCEKTEVKFDVNVQIAIITQTLTFKTTYYFSEKVGFFVKYDTQNTFPQLVIDAGIDPGNSVQTMTSYSLK